MRGPRRSLARTQILALAAAAAIAGAEGETSTPDASPSATPSRVAQAPATKKPKPTPKPQATPTPDPTPATPTASPTVTPTPCTGKFSCVPLEEPIEIVKGIWVRPGKKRSFVFELVESYGGSDVTIPVTMIRGMKPGPTLLLTSTIHGDELNGLPVLLQLRERIPAQDLKGLVIMLPVMNPHGFQRQTRYLPDRRDLNRYFPGNSRGSLANRIADRIFRTFVMPSDYLVDFHTAAGGRSNAPHIRADPTSPEARSLAQGFGGIVVLQPAMPHTLRHAATQAGVPAAAYEGGENGRLDGKSIETGVRGVENVLQSLGMLSADGRGGANPLWMKYSPWIRANTGGIIELAVGLGDLVQANQRLLTIRDTVSGKKTEVRAPTPGIVMAVARSPVAEPGYALLRLGIIQSEGREETPPVDSEEEVPE